MRIKNVSIAVGCQIFKAISEEPRVRILNLILENREMCISDLEIIFDFTQSKTSRHMTYLKNAGILATRKDEQFVFYYIKEEVKEIVKQVFSFLSKDAQLKQDLEIYKTLYSNRELVKNKFESRIWWGK